MRAARHEHAARESERRYRRLLAGYPNDFRSEHGEELVGVLLDGARDDQRTPTACEAADLLIHGLRARIRIRRHASANVASGEPDVRWGDALAAASVRGLGPAPAGTWLFPSWLRWFKWLPVLVAAVAISLAIPYLFFDHALAGYSGTASAVGATGQITYHGLPVRPAGDRANTLVKLNLESVTPRIAVNTAHATLTVLVCSGQAAAVLVYGGNASGPPGAYCTKLSAFHHGTITLGTSADTLTTTGVILSITPHRSGIIRIQGADVTYRQGIRYGHQHVGMDWTLRVP